MKAEIHPSQHHCYCPDFNHCTHYLLPNPKVLEAAVLGFSQSSSFLSSFQSGETVGLTSQLLEAHALYGKMSYGLESSPRCGVLGVFVGSCSEGAVMEEQLISSPR